MWSIASAANVYCGNSHLRAKRTCDEVARQTGETFAREAPAAGGNERCSVPSGVWVQENPIVPIVRKFAARRRSVGDRIRELKPDLRIYFLPRSATYGLREELYTHARSLGSSLSGPRSRKSPWLSQFSGNGSEKLVIKVRDHVLNRIVRFTVDYLNLATAIVPEGEEELAKHFNLPLNADGVLPRGPHEAASR